ncbi:hypothetical protein BJX68DRAFT_239532 [Aspergillus pseudodeflectus]|uniref:Uncharacterized protein n=1 Tax=Aspergillus pseudodeflectus TaxID=176178 RepID=A0ABR4K5T7_9EURO
MVPSTLIISSPIESQPSSLILECPWLVLECPWLSTSVPLLQTGWCRIAGECLHDIQKPDVVGSEAGELKPSQYQSTDTHPRSVGPRLHSIRVSFVPQPDHRASLNTCLTHAHHAQPKQSSVKPPPLSGQKMEKLSKEDTQRRSQVGPASEAFGRNHNSPSRIFTIVRNE